MASFNSTRHQEGLQVMSQLLEDYKGTEEYDSSVLEHMLAFTNKYINSVLDDASAFSSCRKGDEVNIKDLKLALELRKKRKHGLIPPRKKIKLPEISRANVPQKSIPSTSMVTTFPPFPSTSKSVPDEIFEYTSLPSASKSVPNEMFEKTSPIPSTSKSASDPISKCLSPEPSTSNYIPNKISEGGIKFSSDMNPVMKLCDDDYDN